MQNFLLGSSVSDSTPPSSLSPPLTASEQPSWVMSTENACFPGTMDVMVVATAMTPLLVSGADAALSQAFWSLDCFPQLISLVPESNNSACKRFWKISSSCSFLALREFQVPSSKSSLGKGKASSCLDLREPPQFFENKVSSAPSLRWVLQNTTEQGMWGSFNPAARVGYNTTKLSYQVSVAFFLIVCLVAISHGVLSWVPVKFILTFLSVFSVSVEGQDLGAPYRTIIPNIPPNTL